MNAESWVTANEVSQHLGVVKGSIVRWRERERLPAYKIGRPGAFQLLSDVDEWVRAGRTGEGQQDRNC